MKLRNKKTGEVVVGINKIGLVWNKYGMPAEIGQYDSLAELNEEWEDYEPKEPLIKDEEIREAIRAWAKVVGRDRWFVVSYNVQYHDCCIYCAGLIDTALIDMGKDLNVKEGSYTFAELCGEEAE